MTTVLGVLMLWLVVSVPVGLLVGRIIAFGQREPVRRRLAEVRVDRLADEEPALFVG